MRREASLAGVLALAAITACEGSLSLRLPDGTTVAPVDAGGGAAWPAHIYPATACAPGGDGSYLTQPYPTLDAYCMVSLVGGEPAYASGIVPYDLNTPLFSDYAIKRRAVYVPPGKTATYSDTDVFEFPVGSVLIKSFGFPDDARKTAPVMHWIETRLLVRVADGWKAYAYLWDDAQAVATYNPGGRALQVSWIDSSGTQNDHGYLQPSQTQCQQCHEDTGNVTPIGPKARNLNKDYAYADGPENQLTRWTKAKILGGAPADPKAAPKLATWDDAAHYTVEQRARAYLEVNCAHCHDADGSASTSGLFLWASETDPTRIGVCKEPLSAGGSVGARTWDVVPGDPDASILWFRMASTQPGLAMPQISRDVVDKEAVALVRDWITALPKAACNK
jgi:uncharacterized repeat protein (TIGR03806 family)